MVIYKKDSKERDRSEIGIDIKRLTSGRYKGFETYNNDITKAIEHYENNKEMPPRDTQEGQTALKLQELVTEWFTSMETNENRTITDFETKIDLSTRLKTIEAIYKFIGKKEIEAINQAYVEEENKFNQTGYKEKLKRSKKTKDRIKSIILRKNLPAQAIDKFMLGTVLVGIGAELARYYIPDLVNTLNENPMKSIEYSLPVIGSATLMGYGIYAIDKGKEKCRGIIKTFNEFKENIFTSLGYRNKKTFPLHSRNKKDESKILDEMEYMSISGTALGILGTDIFYRSFAPKLSAIAGYEGLTDKIINYSPEAVGLAAGAFGIYMITKARANEKELVSRFKFCKEEVTPSMASEEIKDIK